MCACLTAGEDRETDAAGSQEKSQEEGEDVRELEVGDGLRALTSSSLLRPWFSSVATGRGGMRRSLTINLKASRVERAKP